MVFESRRGISGLNKGRRRSMGAAYQHKQASKRRFYGFLFKIFMFFMLIGMAVSTGVGIFLYQLNKTLPDVDQISVYVPNETTKIYSADKVILAELHKEENRILVPLSNISASLKVAVVALEDARFYRHHGIDIKAILRALKTDIQARSAVQGASTITQQLARNVFLTKHKTIVRKIAEVMLAIQIERKYTKEEILEMYLNQVYWGHNAYGIESASQLYFGKKSKYLTIAESALLVGLLKGPELYSPYKRMDLAVGRQKLVLNRLHDLGYISKEQMLKSRDEEIVLAGRKKTKYKAPFFTSYVIEQLIENYGEDAVYSSGMKVFTTLNYKMQKYAEEAVLKAMDRGREPFFYHGEKIASANFGEAALLSINPSNGYILAMVGGHDYATNEFNKTTQAKRQPGSAFKPFTYLTALEKGLSPGTIVDDAPVTFNTIEGPYSPQNYSKKYKGPMPLRKALELSQNVVAIKVIDLIGPKSVIYNAKKLGIQAKLKNILSLTLGACEVTMMEMAYAYGTFANQGVKAKPLSILRIEDRNGVEIEKYSIKTERVFDSNVVNALVEMMKGVVLYGTGRGAALPRPMAGKTGTTSDYRDAWFIGYVPQMVTVAWVGNDNNAKMNYVTGGWIPARMWKDYMKNALKDIPARAFPKAKKLIPIKVCWESGLRPNENCPEDNVHIEKYWKGDLPKGHCDIHGGEGLVEETKKQDWMDEFFSDDSEESMEDQEINSDEY